MSSTVLLRGLRQEDNEAAWQSLCARYEPMLLAFARRAGMRDQDAPDVAQETLVAFLESLRSGKYDRQRGRLRSWLQAIVVNKVREARRRLAKREIQVRDASDGTRFVNRIPDDRELTDIFDEEWERAVLAECLREVRRCFDRQTLRAFKLYVLEKWPAEKVAQELGLTRNAVYICKTRVMARLRQLQGELAESW